MSTTVEGFEAAAPTRAVAVPWYLWAVVFASTSVIVGVIWDISWHETIGRDTFWTPAHLAIYLGGIVSGLACGAHVLWRSFVAPAEDRAGAVRFWRWFHGPLGAWICIWGSLAMITSAPFDDWWHNAYGLDVEILSPPHVVLILGIIAIQAGALITALARQNLFPADRVLPWIYAYTAGLLILGIDTVGTEYLARPNQWHSQEFFTVSALLFPLLLVGAARGGGLRYPAMAAALIYMVLKQAMVLILPLFAATPMLAPIYNPIDRMMPPSFPLLLILPALAIDTILRRRREWPAWRLAVACGIAFLAIHFAVQWLVGSLLLTPAGRNAFFVADRFPYMSNPGPWWYRFWGALPTLTGMALATGIAVVSARVGLSWGGWMHRVQR